MISSYTFILYHFIELQILKAIVLSHRRHLQRTVSKLDAVKAEGFLQALKAEVNLMTNMVKH